MDKEKDLAEVFEEQSNKIEALETKFSEFEEKLGELPSKDDISKMTEESVTKALSAAFEQAKPGESYGEPFRKSVLALISKAGVEDTAELEEKLKAMTAEELEEIGEFKELVRFVTESVPKPKPEEDGEESDDGGEETGEQDTGAALRNIRAYLKRKNVDEKVIRHVFEILGISKETSDEDIEKLLGTPTVEERISAVERSLNLQGPTYALPTGEQTTDRDTFMERARKDWNIGLEHQEVKQDG